MGVAVQSPNPRFPDFYPLFHGGMILKKQATQQISERLARAGLTAVAFLSLAAMLFLFVSSMIATSDMTTDNPMQELVVFRSDSLLCNVALLVLMIAVGVSLTLLLRRLGWLRRIKPWMLSLGLGVWITLLGILWVVMSLSAPTHDSHIVTTAGYAAAQGDLSRIDSNYFIRFPFQLGYVFWTEIWARLFGLTHSDYLFMEIVNVLCLAFGEVALVLLTEKLFKNRAVTVATTLMLALFFQPVVFCSFLYGTIPGFCFAAWSIFFLVKYMQTDKYRFLLPSAILLAVSVSLKLNNMILLVAAVIILLAHLMKKKPLRRLPAVIILCVTVLTLHGVGRWQYSLRMDKDFGDGIPMVSWLAMGLHDAVPAPGWYNGAYTVSNFHTHNCDSKAAADASVEVIRNRLEEMAETPRETARFFCDKLLSQWNETTYQSIWNNQVRGQFGDKWGVARYVCGEGESRAKWVMDLSVQFIFCGMLAATVILFLRPLKKRAESPEDESAAYLIPLLFLGGFLYHGLFEAKSQYVISYVILMIPYAAWGFAEACGTGKRVWARARAMRSGSREKTRARHSRA